MGDVAEEKENLFQTVLIGKLPGAPTSGRARICMEVAGFTKNPDLKIC